MWFTRKQQPTVIGLWYSANGIGIALGGLFGYGIGELEVFRHPEISALHNCDHLLENSHFP
jgi:hypothetical protein